jgi:O-antigen/teichoic acid export membrane protein
VPKVTQLNEINAAELGQIYKENIKVLMLFAIPIHAMMMAAAGLFSFILLGGLNESFIAILHIVILAWLVNAFTFPAYFIGLGIGQVGLNTVAHFVIGIINLVLGYVLGDMYGVFGVVAASAIALCVGSLMLILVFQRVNNIVIDAIFSYESGLIIMASLALSMAGFVWPIFDSGGIVDRWALFMQLILVASLVVLIIISQFIKTLLNSTFRKEKK